MIVAFISCLVIWFYGTLYPAYASYKAVHTKNAIECEKWLMYWIVHAFLRCLEMFTDIFISWLPFYYIVKIIIVMWLVSSTTEGNSLLYREVVHPILTRHEQDIDNYINQSKEHNYKFILEFGFKICFNYIKNVISQTIIKAFQYQPLQTSSPLSLAQTKRQLNVIEDQHNNVNYSKEEDDAVIINDNVSNVNKKLVGKRVQKGKAKTYNTRYSRERISDDDDNTGRHLRRCRK